MGFPLVRAPVDQRIYLGCHVDAGYLGQQGIHLLGINYVFEEHLTIELHPEYLLGFADRLFMVNVSASASDLGCVGSAAGLAQLQVHQAGKNRQHNWIVGDILGLHCHCAKEASGSDLFPSSICDGSFKVRHDVPTLPTWPFPCE